MSIKAVVLLSGGLDSSTLCSLATSQGREVYAISYDYRQRNRAELNAARKIAAAANVAEHVVFPIDLSVFGGSSLTDPKIAVEKDVPLEKIGTTIPSSYVPARNTIFLSLALGYAETRGAGEIWIGVNRYDYSGYPDCRPEYIEAYQRLVNLATKTGVEGNEIKVVTPLLNMTKAEIIRLGTTLGVDYSLTRTCYDLDDEGRACGRCESCLLRKNGFKEAGVPDPTLYRD